MSNAPGWNPVSHPVHKLIQLHDACAVAFERFRRGVRRIDPNHEDARPQFYRLRDEYRAVILAIHGDRIATQHDVVEEVKNPAIAWFARGDRRREIDVVKSAVVSLLSYMHDPTDAELFQDDNDSFVRRDRGRFTRRQLSDALAMAGEDIPSAIRSRMDLVFNGLPFLPPGADPVAQLPTTQEIIAWVEATRYATEQQPPKLVENATQEPAPKCDPAQPADDPQQVEHKHIKLLRTLARAGAPMSWPEVQGFHPTIPRPTVRAWGLVLKKNGYVESGTGSKKFIISELGLTFLKTLASEGRDE